MLSEQKLREAVSRILQVDPESVNKETPLNGRLSRSIERARLDAVLRAELGSWRSEIYTAKTYGELSGAICGVDGPKPPAPSAGPEVVTMPAPTAQNAAHRVGIDIESVKSIPETRDFWQTPFFRAHFTPAEIAYSLLQSTPAETFAGMWCAKEALKKAAPKWMSLDWLEMEVLHDSSGSPYIKVLGADVAGCSLSISHTSEFAVAVAILSAPLMEHGLGEAF